MSKRKRKHRRNAPTCGESGQRKRIYASKGEALATAARVLANPRNRSASALRAYHCPRCKGYHLTKQVDNG